MHASPARRAGTCSTDVVTLGAVLTSTSSAAARAVFTVRTSLIAVGSPPTRGTETLPSDGVAFSTVQAVTALDAVLSPQTRRTSSVTDLASPAGFARASSVHRVTGSVVFTHTPHQALRPKPALGTRFPAVRTVPAVPAYAFTGNRVACSTVLACAFVHAVDPPAAIRTRLVASRPGPA